MEDRQPLSNTRWIQAQPLTVRLFLAGLIVLVTGLYLYGTVQQAIFVNDGQTDQGAYRSFTLRLYNDLTHIDGNRMPLLPLIVRLLYEHPMDRGLLLHTGNVVGIGISVVAITAIAIIFYHHFRLLVAANIVLITMFSIFVYKAPYYQPELLFSSLYFVAFVLICKSFKQFTPSLAVLIALFLGLAMLAKASAASTLAIFVGLKVMEIAQRSRDVAENFRPRFVVKGLGLVAIVVTVFVILISGYMASSYRIFGRVFYNVNTTFYMWYDSWDEVVAGTRAFGDRRQWPNMPEDELPSLSRYLAEHTPGDIYRRIKGGLEVTFHNHCTRADGYSLGYCSYVAVFGIAAIATILLNSALFIQAARRHSFLIVFCGLFFLSHTLLAAWWVSISSGRRFLLPIFLPLMVVLASIITYPGTRSFPIRLFRLRTDWMTVFFVCVLVLTTIDIYHVLSSDIFFLYGGD